MTRIVKRPLRRKMCGLCEIPLEQCAKGRCGRIWDTLPDGTPLPPCFWVAALREHGAFGALALSKGKGRAP